MLVIFLTLTCTVSLILHETMAMTVQNRYSDVELVSPIYFCAGGTYYEYPVEKKDKGVMMKFDFRINLDQDVSGGILMYEIRRKGNIGSDHPSNNDTTYATVIEEASKMIRLLVFWKIKQHEDPGAGVILVEHDNELVLNEDKMAQLCENVNDMPSDNYRYMWSMGNNTELSIRRETFWRKYLELEIEIFKGFRDEDNTRPMWIDSERQVQSEMAIYFY
jgi:hypothetical protein